MRHVFRQRPRAAIILFILIAAGTACAPRWTGLPPAPETIADGTYTVSTTATPTLTWSASSWSQSGDFAGYQIAIGTSPGTHDTLDWYSVGNVTNVTLTSGFTLTDGYTYFASVRAVTTDGRTSRVATEGDGFIVNTTLPALKCDFSTGSSTDCTTTPNTTIAKPLIRLYRAGGANTSPGTYLSSSGIIQTATTNLLTYSQDYSQAAWSKSNSSINANSTTAPDGSMTASTLVEDATANQHTLSQAYTSTAGQVYTFSVYLKAAARTYCGVMLHDPTDGNISGGEVDLVNGTVSPSLGTMSITPAGNGWYRVSVTGTPTVAASLRGWVKVYNTSGGWTYTGDGASGIYVWGEQLEVGSIATNYTYTGSTSNYGPRLHHDSTSCSSGTCSRSGLLIEPSSNNRVTYSAALDNAAWGKNLTTVTADVITAPDGTVSADKLIADSTSGAHYIYQLAAMTNGQYACGSYFLKQAELRYGRIEAGNTSFPAFGSVSFDLQTGTITGTGGSPVSYGIRAFPNGWYRVWVCQVATATGNGTFIVRTADNTENYTYAGNNSDGFYIWGGQFERGTPVVSSYIPTTTVALTRSLDNAILTDIGSWYTPSAGSFGVAATTEAISPNVPGYSQDLFECSDASTNNRTRGRFQTRGTGLSELYAWIGDTSSAASRPISLYTPTIDTLVSFFTAFSSTDYSLSVRGADVVSSTLTATLPVLTQCFLAQSYNGSEYLNGSIRYFNFYDRRLSDQKLKALSTP